MQYIPGFVANYHIGYNCSNLCRPTSKFNIWLWLCFGHARLIKTRKDVALPRPDKARRVSPGFENWFMYPGVCRVMFLCMVWYDIYVGLCFADNKINQEYISLAANLVKTLKNAHVSVYCHQGFKPPLIHKHQTQWGSGLKLKCL